MGSQLFDDLHSFSRLFSKLARQPETIFYACKYCVYQGFKATKMEKKDMFVHKSSGTRAKERKAFLVGHIFEIFPPGKGEKFYTQQTS